MSFQCSACQRVFTVLSGFDAHQSADYSRDPAVVCADPAALGMTQNQFGRWYTPADAGSRTRLRALRAEQPQVHTPVTPRASEGL